MSIRIQRPSRKLNAASFLEMEQSSRAQASKDIQSFAFGGKLNEDILKTPILDGGSNGLVIPQDKYGLSIIVGVLKTLYRFKVPL